MRTTSNVQVVGSVFMGGGKDGDFGWMIKQPQYTATFFIFNDNEKQWMAHRTNPVSLTGCETGGGNAVIRPYQCRTPRKALGIPTGDYSIPDGPGYPALTEHVKTVVDQAVVSIAQAVAENGYTEIVYSSNGHGGLGTSIFSPAPEVAQYIITRIESLGAAR